MAIKKWMLEVEEGEKYGNGGTVDNNVRDAVASQASAAPCSCEARAATWNYSGLFVAAAAELIFSPTMMSRIAFGCDCLKEPLVLVARRLCQIR